MIDVANGGTSVDTCVAIDRKDLLESGIKLALERWTDKLDGPLRTVGHRGSGIKKVRSDWKVSRW